MAIIRNPFMVVGEKNPLIAKTEDEMTALLASKNIGKVVKYVGEGGGAAVGTPFESGQTYETIYFNTSVTPELSAITLSEDGLAQLITAGAHNDYGLFYYDMETISGGTVSAKCIVVFLKGYEDGPKVIYSTATFDWEGVVASEGWNLDQIAWGDSVAATDQQDKWLSYISSTPFAAGGAYKTNGLYVIGESGAKPIAVGDTISTLYFQPDVEIPLSVFEGLNYSISDIFAPLIMTNGEAGSSGMDNVALLAYKMAGVTDNSGNQAYALAFGGSSYIYVSGDCGSGGSYTPKGWQNANIVNTADGTISGFDTFVVGEVIGQDLWGDYLSKEPIESGGSDEAFAASELYITKGSLAITENGSYDVADKATVEVNVVSESKLGLVVNDVNGGTSTYFDITNDDLGGVTKIKDYAFFNCQGMQSIQLDNITSIGGSTFKACIRLQSAEMPQLTEMKDSAFSGCYNLQSAKMPLVSEIGTDTFNGCSALTEVEISSATTIGQRAFYSCNALTEVEMPSATRIKAEAFSWCQALASVKMPVVQTIEASAFFGCDMLTTLTIPSSCSSIGDVGLQCGTTTNKCTFIFEATTPPTISSRTFDESKINKIIVPAGSGDTYKTASYWSNIASYIEEATV